MVERVITIFIEVEEGEGRRWGEETAGGSKEALTLLVSKGKGGPTASIQWGKGWPGDA
jgi:hypothetical protein